MYSRADLLRILRITARQLAAWEKAGLAMAAESYSFTDFVKIKAVRDLCARKVRPAIIRQSLQAMQKQVAGMENPLLEASVTSAGQRVAFRHEGKLMEPIAGQFMLDFSPEEKIRTPEARAPQHRPSSSPGEASAIFAQAIALEENPQYQIQAIAMYQRVIELDPSHAAANINIGTLYYNRGDFVSAEKHYRRAIEIDRRYALAYFDLANVLDETGRVGEAVETYKAALLLAPTYADAHYNLALAYEKMKNPRKALRHWRAYTKLDTSGPWSTHAAAQVQRIVRTDRLKIVYRRDG